MIAYDTISKITKKHAKHLNLRVEKLMFSRFAGGAGTRIHAVTQILLQDKDITTSAVLVV